MSDSATPWTAAYQAPPSTGFSRQEYWSGVPLPSPILPVYLTYTQSTSCEMPDWMKHKLESRLIAITSDMQITPTLCQKEKSEKAVLKPSIHKMKIMVFGPITSWEIDGETMKTVRDFIFLRSKITADGDCSHEIKRHLLLGSKAMTNLDNILFIYLFIFMQ